MTRVRHLLRYGDFSYGCRFVELNRGCHGNDCLVGEFLSCLYGSRASTEGTGHAGRRDAVRPEPGAAPGSADLEHKLRRASVPLDDLIQGGTCEAVAAFTGETHFPPAHGSGRGMFQRHTASSTHVVLGKLNQTDRAVRVSETEERQTPVARRFSCHGSRHANGYRRSQGPDHGRVYADCSCQRQDAQQSAEALRKAAVQTTPDARQRRVRYRGKDSTLLCPCL